MIDGAEARRSAFSCAAALAELAGRRSGGYKTACQSRASTRVGVWLSLVEHLVRDEGVAGSNPATPTNKISHFLTSAAAPGKHADRNAGRNPQPHPTDDFDPPPMAA